MASKLASWLLHTLGIHDAARRRWYLGGVSSRDHFAAQALGGLLARSDLGVPHCAECRRVGDDPGEHYADISYRYADAMLKARDELHGSDEISVPDPRFCAEHQGEWRSSGCVVCGLMKMAREREAARLLSAARWSVREVKPGFFRVSCLVRSGEGRETLLAGTTDASNEPL